MATGVQPRRQSLAIQVGDLGKVSADLLEPAGCDLRSTPALLLAHGAGNDMRHPFMTFFFEELGREFVTMRFNFLYKELGRGSPDPAPRLERTFEAALAGLRARAAPGLLFAGGKSMGGRIATHLAASGEELAGLVLLGYPLHPPGQPAKLRDAHLADVRCPLLFVQGTRDRLCDLDLLAKALRKVKAPAQVHVVEDGDHSFKVPKRSGRSDAEVLAEVRDVVSRFMRAVAADAPA